MSPKTEVSKRIINTHYKSFAKKENQQLEFSSKLLIFCIVRLTGLEPAHRKTLDPKSSASTNFATGAKNECKGTKKS